MFLKLQGSLRFPSRPPPSAPPSLPPSFPSSPGWTSITVWWLSQILTPPSQFLNVGFKVYIQLNSLFFWFTVLSFYTCIDSVNLHQTQDTEQFQCPKESILLFLTGMSLTDLLDIKSDLGVCFSEDPCCGTGFNVCGRWMNGPRGRMSHCVCPLAMRLFTFWGMWYLWRIAMIMSYRLGVNGVESHTSVQGWTPADWAVPSHGETCGHWR